MNPSDKVSVVEALVAGPLAFLVIFTLLLWHDRKETKRRTRR